MFSDGVVTGQMEVVELRAAVITDQARELLEMVRLELKDRGCGEAMRLLAAGHQGLGEKAAQGLAAM